MHVGDRIERQRATPRGGPLNGRGDGRPRRKRKNMLDLELRRLNKKKKW